MAFNNIDDLIQSSYQAQTQYVANRIHNQSKKDQFLQAVEQVLEIVFHSSLDELTDLVDLGEGFSMAVAMYLETYTNLHSRFTYGRSGDAMLERI